MKKTTLSYGPWRYLPAYLMGNSTAPVPEEKASDLGHGNALELATIYPNPVSDRLNINFKDNEQVQNLKILTAAGAVTYRSNGFQPFVDVSKFSEGTYFLIITKTDGSHTSRQILIRR
ncbi:MAG: T9SS type A sorting domain-containing protein [Dyadobacter sp.]|uniref:T9SS type A sorting domain-containing protein n=1 Tax=Dyadobacter sp. TaxID=1914288 RepID=UPI001B0095E5|nr:T9SS type A sorting domain-containing protein [Dyadobacter sp.]MBO9611765.1 T9SS type A sorting domain-containing protein [Dyadobacter sp.]